MSHYLLIEARDRLAELRNIALNNESGKIDPETQDLIDRIDKHLDSTISVIWDIADVQSIRPDLTDARALEVLQAAKRNHNTFYGITWDTLEFHAEQLFGVDDEGEEE